MKNKRMRLYEGMYVLNAALSEDARKKALAKITDSIVEKGGEIRGFSVKDPTGAKISREQLSSAEAQDKIRGALKKHDLGKKRLAYEIQNKKEGYYYLLYFTIESVYISELWRDYHLHEDLLRFITLRADEVKESLDFKPLAKQA